MLQIAFPAVTVCHQIKTNKRVFDFGRMHHTLLEAMVNASDQLNVDRYELVASMCLKDGNPADRSKIFNYFKEQNFSSDLDDSLLLEMAPSMRETFSMCAGVLSPRGWPCDKGFATVFTEDGVCHSFNLLKSSEMFTNGT